MSKTSSSESWQQAVRADVILARWARLICFRTQLHNVRHTLHGKIGLAVAIILVLMLAPYLVIGFLETLPESTSGLNGLLLATHFWLALALALMFLVQFTKTFLKDRTQQPLVAHPFHSPALNRHRMLAAIPMATLAFTGLFYAYFLHLLLARLQRIWLAIPVHLFTICLLAVSLATVVGFFGRKLLRFAIERGIRNEDLIVNTVVFVAIGTFGAVLLGIIIVNKHAIGIFEIIGSSIAVTIPVGMIPYAAAHAAGEGRWLALFGWLGLSAVMALWALRAMYRWSFSAHREIPIDLATPTRRVFAPAFTGKPGRWLPSGVSAFWRKDIVVSYSREPKRYLFHQVSLLWWGILAVILAMAFRDRGTISGAFAETIPVVVTVLAMAIIAMQNGVNALGREGKELTWLRPLFTGPQLLGRKLFVNVVYVLIHSFTYALIVYAATVTTTLGTTFWTLLLYAVGAGMVFACLATAVGFLFPDFERHRSSLPGSTSVGKGCYLLGALALVTTTGTGHLFLKAGVMDGSSYAGIVTFGLACAVVAFALIAAAAVKQYQGMEI